MLENLFFSSPRIKRIACVAFDGSSSCRMLNVFTIFSNLCRKSLIVTDGRWRAVAKFIQSSLGLFGSFQNN